MKNLDFNSDKILCELEFLKDDKELIGLGKACLEAHQEKELEILKSKFKPNPKASYEVSWEALESILRSGERVHGIRTERHISNVIVFNLSMVKGSLSDHRISELRKKLDRVASDRIRDIFQMKNELLIFNSGHFWYPPGGYMGWHTNFKVPGWRLYISYAQEPGRSFFRYRDPKSSEIVTVWDDGWNFRLFKIDPHRPLWHAVYSETNRFSFGYNINLKPTPRFSDRLMEKAKQVLARAGAF